MLTVLAAIALATVPGGLLALALPPGRYRWAAWASAPALSLGLTAVAMGWLPRLGLPDGAVAVLVAELVLAAGAVLAARVAPRLPRSRLSGSRRAVPTLRRSRRHPRWGRARPCSTWSAWACRPCWPPASAGSCSAGSPSHPGGTA